jgi:hypothetical protein
VVEELTQSCARGVDHASFKREAQYAVHEDASNQRVYDHFQRMFVEGRDDLDPLRAVVDLMKQPPQPVRTMPPPMPPVEDERGNEEELTVDTVIPPTID